VKLLDKLKTIPEKLAVMSPRQLILLAFALSVIVAGIIYIILTGFLTPKQQTVAAPQYQTVVVAAVDIPERTRITKDMLKVVQVPKDVVPQDAVRSADDAVGKATMVKILKEDVITGQKLLGGKGFAGTIPDGMRAITIPVNDVTGVAGLIKPGDYVDIYLISNKSYKNAIYGKLVMQNVLLLAVNTAFNTTQPANNNANQESKQQQQQQQQQQQAAKAGMVTIAVSPSDVLRIEGALQEGTLYLALRPELPSETYTVVPDYFQYMAGGQDEQKAQPTKQPQTVAPAPYYPARTAEAPAPSAGYSGGGGGYSSGQSVEVIRGNSVSQVNVK
jgi:pilus assembly protein CpaB